MSRAAHDAILGTLSLDQGDARKLSGARLAREARGDRGDIRCTAIAIAVWLGPESESLVRHGAASPRVARIPPSKCPENAHRLWRNLMSNGPETNAVEREGRGTRKDFVSTKICASASCRCRALLDVGARRGGARGLRLGSRGAVARPTRRLSQKDSRRAFERVARLATRASLGEREREIDI